jgi:hypothetical protein
MYKDLREESMSFQYVKGIYNNKYRQSILENVSPSEVEEKDS